MVSKSSSKRSDPIKSEILEGLAQYAFLHEPDRGNPKKRIAPSYKIDLMLTDDAQIEKAKALHLNVKPSNEKIPHPYTTIRSKVAEGRNGPRVIDSQKNPIPSNILIGNGSKVRVRFFTYDYDGEYHAAILQEVQVIELVRYERDNSSELGEVKGGFVVA